MQLVFVHGWGFDAHFWDALAPRFAAYKQARFDFGFFGTPSPDLADLIDENAPALLIGHSLGFLYGVQQLMSWAGWVAINGFARFEATDKDVGCVPVNVLRDMQARLAKDCGTTLGRFYKNIGATQQRDTPDQRRLNAGLELLRAGDIAAHLTAMKRPALVLAARRDPLVPVAASEGLAACGATSVLWHETGGHLLPQSDPDWCTAQITAFMERHFAKFYSPQARITQKFNTAAGHYDRAASLQSEVARKLVGDAQPLTPPRHILDLGCGTGFVAAAAAARWPQASITGFDASFAMLEQAQRRVPPMEIIAGEAAQPVLPQKYDLIFSSMMLHWLPQPAQALQRWQKALTPGGRLYVTLLGPRSFEEWRRLCADHGVTDGLWPMPQEDFAAELSREVQVENKIISYTSAQSFLRQLKMIGAASSRCGYATMRAGQMRILLSAAPKPFHVTYQIITVALPGDSI